MYRNDGSICRRRAAGYFLLDVGVGLLGGLTAALVLGWAMIEACKALAHKL